MYFSPHDIQLECLEYNLSENKLSETQSPLPEAYTAFALFTWHLSHTALFPDFIDLSVSVRFPLIRHKILEHRDPVLFSLSPLKCDRSQRRICSGQVSWRHHSSARRKQNHVSERRPHLSFSDIHGCFYRKSRNILTESWMDVAVVMDSIFRKSTLKFLIYLCSSFPN